MISHKNNDIIYLSLEKGEEIMDSIQETINKYNIISGWINGIGLMKNIRIGSYDINKKEYDEVDFEGNYELTSLIGNITKKEGKPFIHAHITMSDHSCNAYGGHLFHATIAAAGEFFIRVTENIIDRKFDKNIGLHLWKFDHCES
tara:strand:- start:10 stop:444 length:435 start_codon:yes stop_codon:yes gene_type:complete